jgi:hypothetical protein
VGEYYALCSELIAVPEQILAASRDSELSKINRMVRIKGWFSPCFIPTQY